MQDEHFKSRKKNFLRTQEDSNLKNYNPIAKFHKEILENKNIIDNPIVTDNILQNHSKFNHMNLNSVKNRTYCCNIRVNPIEIDAQTRLNLKSYFKTDKSYLRKKIECLNDRNTSKEKVILPNLSIEQRKYM